MKTIRNAFQQKHQDMDGRLDTVRKRALDAVFSQNPAGETAGSGRWRWVQLVLAQLWAPCRPAWVGLAGLWVVIGVLHWATPGTEGVREGTWAVAPAEGPLELIMEQRRMVAELLEDGRDSSGTLSVEKPRSARFVGRGMS